MMMSLRKLRKLFRRDSTAHMHPRKKDDELITVQRMERVLRERNISSKSFHVKYVGCTLMVAPTLTTAKGEEVANAIIRKGRKTNKRRVTMTFTPEKIYITDMVYRCGLAQFHMDEIGMFFVHPHNDKLLGVTVKDVDTCGYIFYIYKCSVENFECENVEVLKQYEAMYEEYLNIEPQINHNHHHHHELLICHEESREEIPYFEKLRNTHPQTSVVILNQLLYRKIEKPKNIHLSVSTTLSDPDLQSTDPADCTCNKSRLHKRRYAVTKLKRSSQESLPESSAENAVVDENCRFHTKKIRPERTVRRPILAQLLEYAPPSTETPLSRRQSTGGPRSILNHTTRSSRSEQPQPSQNHVTIQALKTTDRAPSTTPSKWMLTRSSPHPSAFSQFSTHYKLSFAALPTLKLLFLPTASTDGSTTIPSVLTLLFCHTTYTFTVSYTTYSITARPLFSIRGIKFHFSPCSFILSPSISHPCTTLDITDLPTVSSVSSSTPIDDSQLSLNDQTLPLPSTASPCPVSTSYNHDISTLVPPSLPAVTSPTHLSTMLYISPLLSREPLSVSSATTPSATCITSSSESALSIVQQLSDPFSQIPRAFSASDFQLCSSMSSTKQLPPILSPTSPIITSPTAIPIAHTSTLITATPITTSTSTSISALHITASTSRPITTSTFPPITTSTSTPITTSTFPPITTSTSTPITASTSSPITTSTFPPITTSTSTPITTSTFPPITTSTSTPITASTSTPIITSTFPPITTSTSTPITASTSTPITTSTFPPITTSTSTPITASTSTPITTSTFPPITTSTSTPITASSTTPITTSTFTPITTSTSTPTASTTTPITASTSTPITTSTSTPITASTSTLTTSLPITTPITMSPATAHKMPSFTVTPMTLSSTATSITSSPITTSPTATHVTLSSSEISQTSIDRQVSDCIPHTLSDLDFPSCSSTCTSSTPNFRTSSSPALNNFSSPITQTPTHIHSSSFPDIRVPFTQPSVSLEPHSSGVLPPDEAFSYIFSSSYTLRRVSPSQTLPSTTEPAPLPNGDEYVPLHLRKPPKKRITPYILELIKQIDSSLVEAHKQRRNRRIHPKILEVVEKLESA